MASTYRLRVVTPEKIYLDEPVEEIVARGADGDLGVLKGHIPLVTALRTAPLSIKKDGVMSHYALGGGFLEVGKEVVTILTDAIESPIEIDTDRAERALAKAQTQLTSATDLEKADAVAAVKRAQVRLEIAKRK